jgi:GntR family transcriptional repressor for pyruvate dehydrogenase complex
MPTFKINRFLAQKSFREFEMPDNQQSSTPIDIFEAIERESTLSSRVTRQIEALIVDGRLKPGDRLPSERELADQLGVSRTVVREAVRALVAKSLLEVQAGSGTIVRRPSAESVAQSMTLFLRADQQYLDYDKVHEVRRVLEVEIAGLAAQRRNAEDLAEMEKVLREAAEIESDRKHFAKNDVAFHAALADATHNKLFGLLLDSIADIMYEVRYLGFDVPGTPARALTYHHAIFEQVRAGDPEGARQAMREHLIEAEETQRQALALQAGQPVNSNQ